MQSDKYGTALFLEREAEGMDPLQLWRELVQNGAEANATRIVIDGYTDPETGMVLARLTDNGHGLAEAQLVKHMETLHLTGKIAGKNYGIGARIAALPHNQAGVTFASRTESGDVMVKLWKDKGVYGLVDWDAVDDEGYTVKTSTVVPDAGELSRVPAGSTGSAVILHGDGKKSTWNAPQAYAVHKFLAGRYYVFPNDVEVRVASAKSQRVQSTGEVLANIAEADGEVPFKNVGGLNGVMFWWTLPATDERKDVTSGWNDVPGGVGLVVEDEIFNYERSYLGDFGVIYRSVQNRVAILIWIDGSTMESSRAGVVVPGHRKTIPWKTLGAYFAAHMPEEIDALLSKVTVTSSAFDEKLAQLLDKDWMKWLKPTPVAVPAADGDLTTGEEEGEAVPEGESPGEPQDSVLHTTSGKDATHKTSDGKKPALSKSKIVTPEVVFVPANEMPGDSPIAYMENSNTVYVSVEFPPYVREIDRWVESTGHSRKMIEDAVRLGYTSELAGTIIDANGMTRYGVDPKTVCDLKSNEALFAKTLGMQSLTARIEQFLKDAVRAA